MGASWAFLCGPSSALYCAQQVRKVWDSFLSEPQTRGLRLQCRQPPGHCPVVTGHSRDTYEPCLQGAAATRLSRQSETVVCYKSHIWTFQVKSASSLSNLAFKIGLEVFLGDPVP